MGEELKTVSLLQVILRHLKGIEKAIENLLRLEEAKIQADKHS